MVGNSPCFCWSQCLCWWWLLTSKQWFWGETSDGTQSSWTKQEGYVYFKRMVYFKNTDNPNLTVCCLGCIRECSKCENSAVTGQRKAVFQALHSASGGSLQVSVLVYQSSCNFNLIVCLTGRPPSRLLFMRWYLLFLKLLYTWCTRGRLDSERI